MSMASAASAEESDTVVISADGSAITWETTGDVGQSDELYLFSHHTDPAISTGWAWVHAPFEAGWIDFWPSDGPGTYEVELCEWDPVLAQLTVCSNTVEVIWVYDVNGQFRAIPAADPALEQGSIVLMADGRELHWNVVGTLGQTSGFMLLDGNTRYWQPSENRDATWWPAGGLQPGLHELRLCGYDHYRDLLGTCSNPVTIEIAPNCYGHLEAVSELDPYQAAMTAGLAAWRMPGFDGNSCASCHAPDGIDLAYPAYYRADILRRASQHVDPASAEAIADMIETVRARHDWTPTVDPREYRPFQPGGQPLPGDTPIARDEAFADQLVQMGLLIAVGDVDDLATAQQARDELLAVDLWTLPVGVPFDRYSEDIFFGPEHGRFNEWVPSLGHVPSDGDATTWWDLSDLYLATPDEDALYPLLESVSDPDGPLQLNHDDLRGNVTSFEAERFRSLLLLSHEQRREMAGAPARGADDVMPYDTAPIWHTGAIAYETWTCNPIHGGDLDDCMQLPDDGQDPGVSFFEQMESINLAWRYMGWMFNQPLVDIPGEQSLLSGHYLSSVLGHSWYPSHHAFMRSMRAVRKYWGADTSWRDGLQYATPQVPTTSAFADLLFMDLFIAEGHDLEWAPDEGLHLERYRRFTANMYKMLLLLLEHEIDTTGQVYDKERLVEMLRGQTAHRWYGPADFLPLLVTHEPQQELWLVNRLEQIAVKAELAQEVAALPVSM
ncbi:MAG: hypothetical protein AAGF11_34765 [Myxococcota bacterium]